MCDWVLWYVSISQTNVFVAVHGEDIISTDILLNKFVSRRVIPSSLI